jgi:hypothetical protein
VEVLIHYTNYTLHRGYVRIKKKIRDYYRVICHDLLDTNPVPNMHSENDALFIPDYFERQTVTMSGWLSGSFSPPRKVA